MDHMKSRAVLEVKHLKTYFYLDDGEIAKAVDDVDFSVYPGETVALVGESGCGKSVTSLSIMQLVSPPGEIVSGSVKLEGTNLLELDAGQMTKIRGNDVAMIFQEPMTALNPVFTVGSQITEILRKHKKMNKKDAHERTVALLETVGLPRAGEIMNEYPHQLSGGMRQRVMIAMAIACEPKLLIADEPTTALDVTIQAQILDLMVEMKSRFHMALLLITHDLGIVAEYADRVLVMYGGQIVEQAPVRQLFKRAKHPYTQALLASLPTLDRDTPRLGTVRGTVPPAHRYPDGCRFSTRCPHVMDVCRRVNPAPARMDEAHNVRCHLYTAEEVNV